MKLASALCLVASTACFRSVVFPETSMSDDQVELMAKARGFERVSFRSADATLLDGIVRDHDGEQPVLFYVPGNGMSLRAIASILDQVDRTGGFSSLVAFAYRGYDTSEGEASEEAVVQDLRELFRWTEERYSGRCIVVLAQSLGTGLSVRALASSDGAVNGLVLLSPYTSMSDVFHDTVPASGWLVADSIDTAERIANLDLPIVIVHGVRDELITIDHGRHLAQLAQNAQIVELSARAHNDLWSAPTPVPAMVADAAREFCQK